MIFIIRRLFLLLFSPVIFVLGLIVYLYILLDAIFSGATGRPLGFRPFRIVLYILIMLLSSIGSSLYCTAGCVRDGSLRDFTEFCKDAFSK